jgi:hypothetical protein
VSLLAYFTIKLKIYQGSENCALPVEKKSVKVLTFGNLWSIIKGKWKKVENYGKTP